MARVVPIVNRDDSADATGGADCADCAAGSQTEDVAVAMTMARIKDRVRARVIST